MRRELLMRLPPCHPLKVAIKIIFASKQGIALVPRGARVRGDDVINCLHLRKELAGGSMSSSNNTDFDFEAWAALAKADPQVFEARRRAVIAEAIAAMPPHQQARMRGLQWRIDMERTRYRHPLVSCTQLFNQMWSTVYGEGGLVDALNGRVSPASESAAILPFAPVKPQSPEGVALHS